ncbi:MAG: hypothetical protein IPM82_21690, partial [Saprospiraceae bacterium]|nr:hypothetical protein [Saprospiraceae bacterium]
MVQTATTGLACTSPPTTLNVNPIPSFSVTGDGQVCREQTGIYAVPFYENIDYQWVISPADNGTIVSGVGSSRLKYYGIPMAGLGETSPVAERPKLQRDGAASAGACCPTP